MGATEHMFVIQKQPDRREHMVAAKKKSDFFIFSP
jgi:hypothetical protein